MDSPKNILVIGATGVIGVFITQAILDASASFGNVAIFTSQSTVENKKELLQKWQEQGVEVIVGDLTKDTDISEAYKRFDTVVCALGRNVLAEQINLIKLAEASQTIKRFFPSEYGTDIDYCPQSANEKPHQQKLKARKYIRDNVRRLEYTYLVTGPYVDLYISNAKSPEYGSFNVKAKKAVLLGTGNEPVSFTTMADVGKLVVAALQHYKESKDRALKVNSFTTTPHEILKEFEKQTGEKWEVSYTSLPELKRLEQKLWDEQNPTAALCTMRRIWTEGGTLYEKTDNDAIGSPSMDTLSKVVSQSIQAQTC